LQSEPSTVTAIADNAAGIACYDFSRKYWALTSPPIIEIAAVIERIRNQMDKTAFPRALDPNPLTLKNFAEVFENDNFPLHL
jgi:hypothetical protein